MRGRRWWLVVAIATVCAVAPASHAASVTVFVRNNVFEPDLVRIDPGDSVTWTAIDSGHTATSLTGVWDSGRLAPGESFEFRFDEVGIYRYICAVHGRSMGGQVVVGDPVPARTIHTVPSAETPTLASALQIIDGNAEIRLLPGRHPVASTVRVIAPRVTITGWDPVENRPAARGEVELYLAGGASYAFEVATTDTKIADISITGFRVAGIRTVGAERYELANVHAVGNAEFGALIESSRGGRISGGTFSGSRYAGIAVRTCRACGLVVENVTAEESFHGLLAEGAGGIVVRGSLFARNGTGITLRSSPTRAGEVQVGSHITGNDVRDSGSALAKRPSRDRALESGEIASGAGIWIAGGSWNVVDGNALTGNLYGIAVTAYAAPVASNRIVGNVVDGSRAADLGYDGVGVANCFSRNVRPDGSEATSEPVLLQQTAACELPVALALPAPQVSARLLAAGAA